MGFKRISKTPLPKPVPVPLTPVQEVIKAVGINYAEIAKMTAEEAYKKGTELGEALNKLKVPARNSANVPYNTSANSTPASVAVLDVDDYDVLTDAKTKDDVWTKKLARALTPSVPYGTQGVPGPPLVSYAPPPNVWVKGRVKDLAAQQDPAVLPAHPWPVVTTLFKRSDTGIGWKQWSIWCETDAVIVEWGHCDKAKQAKRHSFLKRPEAARLWMHEAVTAKLKSGYNTSKV